MYSFHMYDIKSFKNSGEIELKPITILAGKNSCGKSSLLRFPAVLAQTAEYNGKTPPVSFIGKNIDYGNYEDIVFGKNSSKKINFSLSYYFDISGNTKVFLNSREMSIRKKINSEEDKRKVTLYVSLERDNRQIKVKKIRLKIDDDVLSCLKRNEDDKTFLLEFSRYYCENKLEVIKTKEKIKMTNQEVTFEKFFPVYKSLEGVIKCIARTKEYDLKDETEIDNLIHYCMMYDNGLSRDELLTTNEDKEIARVYKYFSYSYDIMKIIQNLFVAEYSNLVSYIGPFRNMPERIYRDSESVKKHVGVRGENIGDILVGFKYSDKSHLYSDVSKWLEEYFGYKLDIIELGKYFQIVVEDSHSLKSNIIDVGFGISQVLPIILEICMAASHPNKNNRENSLLNNIILIEQPELHLHPAAQACLADLFAMCVSKNPNARLIIETHSEHLISKLQVLIADPDCDLTNDMVQVLYVDKNEDGSSYIDNIGIKENGKFEKEWPKDFFDQGYQLALKLMRKSASRNK